MPAIDTFQNYTPNMQSPVSHAEAITPNDATDLGHVTRAIYVGGAGDVQVTLVSGDTVTFAGLTAGWHPVRAARVWTTATTATNLVGCW